MLFNSFEFIFLFLPIVLLIFYTIHFYGANTSQKNLNSNQIFTFRPQLALGWLVAASCFYYGWWAPEYLILIIGSMCINFFLGRRIIAYHKFESPTLAKILLTLGISANLMLLAYYKYAGFIVDNLNWLIDGSFPIPQIILPLAISFFTFQQIAYLIDTYEGKAQDYSFESYALFVTFFPQLIAGPIVHHKEMMPQFYSQERLTRFSENFSIGLSLFAIGLFKKVVIADSLAPFATSVFTAADGGKPIEFFEAWAGSLAYTFQLYFDFSGYADMALGSARLFGIVLPANFYSPYKSKNIIEFWRRWHITLSRFLKDYLYIPLGGNRKGKARRYLNLFITMLLGGIWHGAGWNFLLWGGLHGVYLIINHAFQLGSQKYKYQMPAFIGILLTFMSVVVAWVFFRAQSFSGALIIIKAMFDFSAIQAPETFAQLFHWCGCIEVSEDFMGHVGTTKVWAWVFIASAISFTLPNTLQWFEKGAPALKIPEHTLSRWQWQPSPAYAVLCAGIFFIALFSLTRVSEFLYFQF